MKIIDMHCDTLYELNRAKKDGIVKCFNNNDLHIDLEKLKIGDYLLQCFAAYVNKNETANPLENALEEIDIFYQIMKQHSKEIAQVKEFDDIINNQRNGKISAMLTMEEGASCLGNLSVLRMFYQLGVRMMTLTWNFENELGYPNIIPKQKEFINQCLPNTKYGLKEKGIKFLEEMERIHMIVDVSHLSDAGFWDVVKYSKRPFIASHSNARAISPHVRNLNDDMLKAIGNKGGLIGVNFYSCFLDKQEREENCSSKISYIIEHISHIKQIAGIEAIGLGSDFDGFTCDLELQNASFMPYLVIALQKNGFHESEIERIFYKNALRVFEELL